MNTLDYIQKKYNLDLSQSPVEIPNVNRIDLAKLFGELGFKEGAEIGVDRGEYAEVLCENIPGLEYHGVDSWEPYQSYVYDLERELTQLDFDVALQETEHRLAKFPNAYLYKGYSHEVSHSFANNSLDFVYIDGNHSLRWVIDDIDSWLPKIRPGGIIAGHDYIRRSDLKYTMHVVEAVNVYVKTFKIQPWFVMGVKQFVEGYKRDRPRSWFWVV